VIIISTPPSTIKGGGNTIHEAGFIERGSINPRVCRPQGLYLQSLCDLWGRFVTKFTQYTYESLWDTSLGNRGAQDKIG